MTGIETLGFNVGMAFASGLNLYATVAVLGLLQRFDVINLPSALGVLAHPAILAIAISLYVIEFVADKVPYVDTIWDSIHTFIRPPAAAVLAYAAFGNVPEVWRLAGGLLAGSIALTAHGTKATTRAAINTSPEPFSNWMASLGEDGLAVFLVWMAVAHPLLSIGIIAILMAISIYLLVKLSKFVKRLLSRIARSAKTS